MADKPKLNLKHDFDSDRAVGNRGETKLRRSVAKDAVRKPESDSNNGGNWTVVAHEVTINIAFNF
ncbi:MP1 [Adonis mosaic virus]|uniref:MP1 n=1 Tax=Adonis mosaic virus TaxID=1883104 RepID=A0A1J1E249_9TOMB|nr:MP1 [Adonis mosaic virus]BAV91504.1 MP1 [Adonis mosaic virus]